MQPRSCQEGERSRESPCLQCAFTPLAGDRRRQRRTRSMVHGKNRIPYWIDRRLSGLAGPEYHAIISIGLPIEPEDSQYGESWLTILPTRRLCGKQRERVVPRRRLELLQPIRPQRPQRCVSTNSTTSALRGRVGRRAWTPGAIIGKRGRGCLSAWRAEPLIAYHIVGTI